MPPDELDQARLLDMLQHARGVVAALSRGSREKFDSDEDFRLALERRIEIIGEAARGISKEFQTAHADIPWRKIVTQRHILAHDYGILNYDLLWKVVAVHVPELVGQLELLLPGDVGAQGACIP